MSQLSAEQEAAPECVKETADPMPPLFHHEPTPNSVIALDESALLQLLTTEKSLRAMLMYRQMQSKIDKALRAEN